jgi:hypothetical protein
LCFFGAFFAVVDGNFAQKYRNQEVSTDADSGADPPESDILSSVDVTKGALNRGAGDLGGHWPACAAALRMYLAGRRAVLA